MIWLRMLAPWRGRIAVLIPAVVLGVCATLSAPLVLRYGIDHGLGAHIDAGVLRGCALVYLGILLVNLGLQYAQMRIAGAVGEAFVRDVRRRTFRHLMGMDSAYFDANSAGALIARQTADIDALQDVVQVGGVQLVQAAFSVGVLAVLLLVLSWKLSLLCLAIPLAPLLWASWRFRRHSAPVNNELRDRIGATMGSLAEGLAGMRVVRAFGQERRMFGRFAQRSDEQLATYLRSVRIESRYLREMEACTGLAMVIAVAGGVILVQQGQISAGTLSAFVLYLLMLFDPLQALGYLLTMLQAALAALRKLSVLLDTEPELAPGPLAQLPASGDIELRAVDFGYGPGSTVLHRVSVTIRAGETLALVGPTGAGKSTLAKLAARLHDPTSGSVTFAGVDLREASFEALRSRIIMASQEGHLFQGTVAANVAAGRPGATEQDALRAIQQVGVQAVIDALPDGADTQVGERGAFLSAGQRQAVSLARIALSEATVVVLDETTSSMDPGTEAIVHRAVTRLARGRTLIIIAHRLSTVRESDRIAVIADGGIAELGTPEQLIAAGGRYAALSRAWDGARGMSIDELGELIDAPSPT
ncbi:MAG: ABC transporter ATP-binding protein/permease [Frankiaceae bacterium]|jgi:ATP-binding cassette subfamily B protein|nr:ABC transporter ATP-binding protein/permease [Frankiaceae bacterium]